MSLFSAPSTWSICTGALVWVDGIVPPSSSSGALGVPGRMSTKKLPSRKIRGRIFSVASSCSGSASSLISIVTLDAVEPSPAASTLVTLPTSTPAIRTGELIAMALVFSNTAVIS